MGHSPGRRVSAKSCVWAHPAEPCKNPCTRIAYAGAARKTGRETGPDGAEIWPVPVGGGEAETHHFRSVSRLLSPYRTPDKSAFSGRTRLGRGGCHRTLPAFRCSRASASDGLTTEDVDAGRRTTLSESDDAGRLLTVALSAGRASTAAMGTSAGLPRTRA